METEGDWNMDAKCDCANGGGAGPAQDGIIGCCETRPTAGSGKRDAGNACCAPGADCCGTGAGLKAMKTAICAATLLAIIGILAYKATVAGGNMTDAVASANTGGFSFAQLGQQSQAADDSRPAAPTNPEEPADVGEMPEAKTFGVTLDSLGDLGEVAEEQDAVFIFIPGREDDPAENPPVAAALAAQKTLERNKVALGLYTLPRESSDYAEIAEQVGAPAVLVARKGMGMNAVTGKATEQKLLQAFVAASAAGCCGPTEAASSCCP